MVDGPLSGVRILDLTHVWAGPLGVRFLADLGAEVVKVEAPLGRGPRVYPSQPIGGWLGGQPGDEPFNANALFAKLHRNRRSLCVDMKRNSGRELFLKLVAVADVVVENFSARAMPSMGLSYERLREANPAIIYLTMPGYGSYGPYSERVAFGPSVEPLTGLSNMLGYAPGQAPRNTALALLDPVGGTHAAAAVTAALRRRDSSGQGCRVEVSLHECGVCLSGPWLLQQQIGPVPHCAGNGHPAMAPHGIYRCAGTDNWVAVCCADDEQWCALVALLESTRDRSAAGRSMQLHAQWSVDERLARQGVIDDAVNTWTMRLDKHTAARLLQQAGVSAGPVNTVPDMLQDEQVRHRRFFSFTEKHDVPMPGNPVHMPGLDARQWKRCPDLGADNHAVLADWLGLDESEVGALVEQGVLADKPPA